MGKKINLKKLSFVNFKGMRNVTVDFDGEVVTISGKNGTGKTTVADGFTWVLWGKDSEGNSDSKFGIKTTDAEGKVINDLNHEVGCTLEVTDTDTGETQLINLRRVYVEEWHTPKGETQRILKGHRTDFFYNDVPLKTKNEYDQRVADILPEAVFKLLTSPKYFLNLHWEAQREILMQIAGGVSDAEIASRNADFAKLLADLTGKSLEDFKKEVAASINRVNKELDVIPTRIDEVTRSTPAAPDFAALEEEKASLEKELEDIDAAATSIAEANRQAYEKANELQKQINAKAQQQQTIIFQERTKRNTEAAEANAAYYEAERLLQVVKQQQSRELSQFKADQKRLECDVKRAQDNAALYEQKTDEARNRWFEVNAEEFKEEGALTCPLFKHCCTDSDAKTLYYNNTTAARETFYKDKEVRLGKINAEGQQLAAQVEEYKRQEKEAAAALLELEKRHVAEAAKLTQEADKHALIIGKGKVAEAVVIPSELPAYNELQRDIDSLKQQLTQAQAGTDNADTACSTRARKAELTGQLDEVKAKLNLRQQIENSQKRVAELNQKAGKLAQEKAELQGKQIVIEAFVKARMEEVERRVNGLFQLCRFKMFKTQVNGEEAADCICYVEGTRYQDKNRAGKINAGLDVINTLCAFHNVNAPIFVDNAEAVNAFLPTASQLVKLVVTNDEFNVSNR